MGCVPSFPIIATREYEQVHTHENVILNALNDSDDFEMVYHDTSPTQSNAWAKKSV